MRRFSFLGSLGMAVVLAIVAFLVIYFFIPSLSNEFFGFSWQSSQDVKYLKESVAQILEKAKVPQAAIDEYLQRMEEAQFTQKLIQAAQRGEDAVIDVLASIGEGIDFVSFHASQLGEKLSEGFSSLGTFTSRQLKALQRILSEALETKQ